MNAKVQVGMTQDVVMTWDFIPHIYEKELIFTPSELLLYKHDIEYRYKYV